MSSESILESRKQYQKNKMLSIIRLNENVSRNDIKKITAYSMTTVLNAIDEMISKNQIYEEQCNDVRIGRKPVWLRLNAQWGYFVGVEFNRYRVWCVVLDFTGKLVFSGDEKISGQHKRAKDVIGLVKSIIRKTLDYLELSKEKVIGIGLGVPGYSNKKTGVAVFYDHIEDWKNIPIKKIIEDEFNIPCYMDNNINVMIYAYKWLVYHGKCEDMLFISIRSGARLIPIINNQPVSSTYGYSGELGHVKIKGGSRLCSCGRYGCLNSEISDVAVVNKIIDGIYVGRFKEIQDMTGGDPDLITMSVFVESVRRGHEDSLKLLKQIGGFMGDAIGMLVNIFAPKKIVLFGELAEIGDLLLDQVREIVRQDTIEENSANLEIVASEFGRNLGAMGAAALVMQDAFEFVDEKI